MTRQRAAAPCLICGQSLGYGRRLYGHAHADCLETRLARVLTSTRQRNEIAEMDDRKQGEEPEEER